MGVTTAVVNKKLVMLHRKGLQDSVIVYQNGCESAFEKT